MTKKTPGFETRALHAGHEPDSDHYARAVPIYSSASYMLKTADRASALFNHEEHGHFYSRVSNPTVEVLEKRLAALEGGVAALCTASGQAALSVTLMTLLSQGAHIVSSRSLYAGSYNILEHILPRFGIKTTFVDPRDIDAFKNAVRPETRLIYGEIIGNPLLEILDIPALSDIANKAGVPLMVDATFTTPYLCRPLEHGAHLVSHSITKWLGGHGAAIGGVVIDGGTFDWQAKGYYPTITEPCAAQGDLNFYERFGAEAFIERARVEGLRGMGASMAPQTAFNLLLGIETLPLRMEQHVANTRQVVRFLEDEMKAGGAVTWIAYPELADSPDHTLAQKMMPKGTGGIVTFGIKGGATAGRKFVESLELVSHLANVGDAKSLVIQPSGTTQQEMPADVLEDAGIGDDLIRLSVGLENIDDILEDLQNGLKQSQT